MNEELEQVKRELAELKEQFKLLSNNTTIPLEVGEAFKTRILSDAGVVALSNKSLTSENTTVVDSVNFGASSVTTVSALGAPNGFFEVTINGIVRYIPFYT